jgi:hypothetical protein
VIESKEATAVLRKALDPCVDIDVESRALPDEYIAGNPFFVSTVPASAILGCVALFGALISSPDPL